MTATPLPPPPAVEPPTAEQAPPPPARPELRRSGTDRMLGGVCGGLAEYSRIDPLLWRVGAVALTLMGPGLFVYLLLWVLMEPAREVPENELSIFDGWATRLHARLTRHRAAPTG